MIVQARCTNQFPEPMIAIFSLLACPFAVVLDDEPFGTGAIVEYVSSDVLALNTEIFAVAER